MSAWEGVLLPSRSTASRTAFVKVFGEIYEHSPWIAGAVWDSGIPQIETDFGDLAEAMRTVVNAASNADKLALLRAHPELASKALPAGVLTQSSSSEQRSAGLDRWAPEELAELRGMNDAFRVRFGFPFIIAVTGLTRADIIEALQARFAGEPAAEWNEAFRQVHRIARIRLKAIADAGGQPR